MIIQFVRVRRFPQIDLYERLNLQTQSARYFLRPLASRSDNESLNVSLDVDVHTHDDLVPKGFWSASRRMPSDLRSVALRM